MIVAAIYDISLRNLDWNYSPIMWPVVLRKLSCAYHAICQYLTLSELRFVRDYFLYYPHITKYYMRSSIDSSKVFNWFDLTFLANLDWS